MSVCREPGCAVHYGCRLRAKGVQFDATVVTRGDPVWREMRQPSWEAGLKLDPRPDGTAMPVLSTPSPDRAPEPVRIKAYGESRRHIDESIRRLSQASAPTG